MAGDPLAANAVFMDAFYTDVRPALAEWRAGDAVIVVAAGALGVEKQCAQTGSLGGDGGGGAGWARADNDEVDKLIHAPHSASATRWCTGRGNWATVSALYMGPSNLQGRYL